MSEKYTDEDVKEYINTICPSNLLGADLEIIRKSMEAQGWKPGVPVASANKFLIDRVKPFDPVKFFGEKGWIIKEEDERSLALVEIDPGAIQLEHMLKSKETSITRKERLKRLKQADYLRLDAKIFQTFWENQHLIPESWKENTNCNTTFVYFDGTDLQDPNGHRCVLYLYWNGGEWRWHCDWLGYGWRVHDPSAVLAS